MTITPTRLRELIRFADDRAKATRYAITRCAAEIGRTMK